MGLEVSLPPGVMGSGFKFKRWYLRREGCSPKAAGAEADLCAAHSVPSSEYPLWSGIEFRALVSGLGSKA